MSPSIKLRIKTVLKPDTIGIIELNLAAAAFDDASDGYEPAFRLALTVQMHIKCHIITCVKLF